MGKTKKAKVLPPSDKEKRGKRSSCRCTRCGAYSSHFKHELKKPGGMRCVCCGGNVLLARSVYDCDLDREYQRIVAKPVEYAAPAFLKDSDERVAEFMELVDCEAHEVKDTPPRPVETPLTRTGRTLSGDSLMPFGKHRGKRLRAVPPQYLNWLANAPNERGRSTPTGVDFKRELRHYLKRCS